MSYATTPGEVAISAKGRLIGLALPSVGFVFAAASSLALSRNPLWIGFLLFATAVATAAAWLILQDRSSRLLDWLEANGARIVLVVMALFAIGLIALNVFQAATFSLGAYPEDLAYYNQVLWNTLDGRFLLGNLQQERLYDPPVYNDLALHVSPLLLAVLLPLYAAAPSFMTLLVVRDLALVGAAWPLFSFARERLGAAVGVAAVLLFLLNPAVLAQGVGSLTLLQFSPLPFFAALLAFQRKNFAAFMFWTLMTLCVREDTFILVAGLGLLAVVSRYPWRWAIAGFVVPLAWWAVVTLFVQPAFGRFANSPLDLALAEGDGGPMGMYRVLLSNWSWLAEAFDRDGWMYVYELLRSVGGLAVLGLEGVVALPSIVAALFLGRVSWIGTDTLSRFAMMSSCALIASSVMIVARLAPRIDRGHARALALIALLLLPCVSLLDGLKEMTRGRFVAYLGGHDSAALNEGIGLVPRDASVAAPIYALPALSARPKLYTIEYLDMYENPDVAYFLVDSDVGRITSNPDLRLAYTTLLERLADTQLYRLVWQRGSYSLFESVASR